MKTFILAASLLVMTSSAMATDVGVSINIGQPNFYGRIDIGDFGRPQLLFVEPMIIQRPVRYVERAPIYLRVPPGHAKKWSKHCGKYNACGQQVYFVQDGWYQNEYAPRYREQHGHGGRDDRRDDRRDERYEKHDKHDKQDKHDKGHGNGHGNGNGNGKGRGND
jgi:hypothetical protein